MNGIKKFLNRLSEKSSSIGFYGTLMALPVAGALGAGALIGGAGAVIVGIVVGLFASASLFISVVSGIGGGKKSNPLEAAGALAAAPFKALAQGLKKKFGPAAKRPAQDAAQQQPAVEKKAEDTPAPKA